MKSLRQPEASTSVLAGLAVLIIGLLATSTTAAVMRSGGAASLPQQAGVATAMPALEPAHLQAPAVLSSNPVKVRIPAIDVDADLDGLGLNDDGTLEVPPYDRAGWYEGGPKPGETGPAVIAAHVDSTDGPAVFFDLKLLETGDTVSVDYDDGTAVDFVVTRSERFPKSEFPTDLVYGETNQSDLRLITCGGSFDRRARSYRENLVVWARAITPSFSP